MPSWLKKVFADFRSEKFGRLLSYEFWLNIDRNGVGFLAIPFLFVARSNIRVYRRAFSLIERLSRPLGPANELGVSSFVPWLQFVTILWAVLFVRTDRDNFDSLWGSYQTALTLEVLIVAPVIFTFVMVGGAVLLPFPGTSIKMMGRVVLHCLAILLACYAPTVAVFAVSDWLAYWSSGLSSLVFALSWFGLLIAGIRGIKLLISLRFGSALINPYLPGITGLVAVLAGLAADQVFCGETEVMCAAHPAVQVPQYALYLLLAGISLMELYIIYKGRESRKNHQLSTGGDACSVDPDASRKPSDLHRKPAAKKPDQLDLHNKG